MNGGARGSALSPGDLEELQRRLAATWTDWRRRPASEAAHAATPAHEPV